ncbi:hypothetical protein BaRGS_00018267 [Batillaria attramentaria]|uniref:Uncharacterized protein n=1 Tax=Batillaria attramentaria TaxID=370345 RepID=A0ABD0KT96_9CAEN
MNTEPCGHIAARTKTQWMDSDAADGPSHFTYRDVDLTQLQQQRGICKILTAFSWAGRQCETRLNLKPHVDVIIAAGVDR